MKKFKKPLYILLLGAFVVVNVVMPLSTLVFASSTPCADQYVALLDAGVDPAAAGGVFCACLDHTYGAYPGSLEECLETMI